jgi:hypothetical protein
MADISILRGAAGASSTLPLAGDRSVGAPSESASFQALLERLQKLAAAPKDTPAVATADDLGEALRAAERTFTTAMDLRRQLEEAFRRHTP